MDLNLYLNFFIAILALINPISRLPFWKELTEDLSPDTRKQTALYITLTGAAILVVFLVSGKAILNFFSIDLDVFKIAGGILLLNSGLSMISGKVTSLENREEEGDFKLVAKKRFEKVIVPMAVPMLAGPGSITTAVLFSSKAKEFLDYAVLSGILLLNLFVIYLFFAYSSFVEKRVDDSIFTVLTRILGIIVTAIGVQFMVEGIGEVFPTLSVAPDVSKGASQE